ncbi:MAG: YncE family protein [Flavobacteriaceae bacterium]|nr:YncE family protein [Flavobacteriaceae bacterium]
MKTLKFAVVLLTLLFLNSCTNDDEPVLLKGDYEKGYFIINEGPFQNGTGTIIFVGNDAVISKKIYKTVNGEDLGNIVNSMILGDEKAYIVVNNSHKIIVVNRYTMEKITTIEGDDIKNPRYFVIKGNTGYVSNWGDSGDPSDDFISVIDLSSNTVSNTIPVGEGPEKMLLIDNNLFVALQGGWSQNNKIVVIDTENNSIKETVTIGDVPNSLVSDDSGNIWVLCAGNPSHATAETAGSLYKISTNNLEATALEFASTTDHPAHLTNDGDNLYYNLNGKVYKMNSSLAELPSESISSFDGFYYTMRVNNGKLFATDAGNFTSEGKLKVFDLASKTLLNTIETGIIPRDIVFQ